MTRALVIGGTGFVGQAACKELMRRGVETIAASRTEHPYGTFTSHRAFDRRDPAALGRVLDEVRPDVIVDLACQGPDDIAALEEVFAGERYVLLACLEREDGSAARLAGSRLPWTVLRLRAVFGPADPSLRIAACIQMVEDGGPVLVPAETYREPAGLAWVRDAGYACALAADLRRPLAGRTYDVALDGVTLEDLLRSVGAALAREPELVPVPFADLPEGAAPYGPDPARPPELDLSRSRAELGFEPSALDDAVADTMPWYRVRRTAAAR